MSTVFFGYICPRCKSTVDIGVAVGQSIELCPQCQTRMIPNPGGRSSAANVYCSTCRVVVGLVNSDRCPQCGGLWQPLP